MAQLLKIYNTYICPASDELLDLGSNSYRWKDFYLSNIAYINQINMSGIIEMTDNAIHSLTYLYGATNNVFVDLSTDGRIVLQALGIGSPFDTPDIKFIGSSWFDSDGGLEASARLMFRDSAIYINSVADGHLDLTADTSIDLNSAIISIGTTDVLQFRDTPITINSATDGHLDFNADISFDFNGATDTDIVLNFTGTTNSGILTWMEDEDYFQFSDDLLILTDEKIQFRDTAITINSATDGHLDLTADTSVDINALLDVQNIYPAIDNTYWLGKNDAVSPLGFKGLVLKDTTDGNHYVIKVINGTITAIDVTESGA